MADVRTVITRFTVEDDFTNRVTGMIRATEQLRAQVGSGRISLPGLLTSGTRGLTGLGNVLGGGLGAASASLARIVGVVGLLVGAFLAAVTVTRAVVNAFTGLIFAIGSAAAHLIATLGGGIILAGKSAAEIAARFDNMERSFAAFTGSLERGRQIAEFVEAFGLKSPFEQLALQEAARNILAVGGDLRQLLPVAQSIALARGAEPQNIIEVSELIARALTGAVGFAFGERGLRRFGITPEDLQAAGARLKRTQQGIEFLGDERDALRVLLGLGALPKFAELNQLFETAPLVRFSNAMDAVNKVMRQIGQEILAFVLPFIETFANTLLQVGRSGVFTEALQALRESLSTIASSFTQNLPNLIEQAAATVAAIVKNLPEIWNLIVEATKRIGVILLQTLAGMLTAVAPLLLALGLLAAPAITAAIVGTKAVIEQLQKGVGAISAVIAGDVQAFLRAIRAAREQKEEEAEGEEKKAPEPPPITDLRPALQAAAQVFSGDVRRFALGGGDVGRFGLTEVERARIGALGRNPEVQVRVRVLGVDRLGQMFEDLIAQALAEYERVRGRVARSVV